MSLENITEEMLRQYYEDEKNFRPRKGVTTLETPVATNGTNNTGQPNEAVELIKRLDKKGGDTNDS